VIVEGLPRKNDDADLGTWVSVEVMQNPSLLVAVDLDGAGMMVGEADDVNGRGQSYRSWQFRRRY
jgi:hypothetical protein